MKAKLIGSLLILLLLFSQCRKEVPTENSVDPVLFEVFGHNIDLNNTPDFNSDIPSYIQKDIYNGQAIANKKALLGRVFFYDKKLSIDNSISCSSCHIQAFAFGDSALSGRGVENARTHRQPMRLMNLRHGRQSKFFWDKRANSLEELVLMPIVHHLEMGYSGQSGRPALADLIIKLNRVDYYSALMNFAYGDTLITEERLSDCLKEFVSSIVSFDSRYDMGRKSVSRDEDDFPNFTEKENLGKNLFLHSVQLGSDGKRAGGGLGCNGCHTAPEFDIGINNGNNGITGLQNSADKDYTVTRSPSLRNLTRVNGAVNTPMMHTGEHRTLEQMINHYNDIPLVIANSRVDTRLFNNGNGQKLQMTQQEKEAVIAFLKTLAGSDVYTDKRWSNPFLQ